MNSVDFFKLRIFRRNQLIRIKWKLGNVCADLFTVVQPYWTEILIQTRQLPPHGLRIRESLAHDFIPNPYMLFSVVYIMANLDEKYLMVTADGVKAQSVLILRWNESSNSSRLATFSISVCQFFAQFWTTTFCDNEKNRSSHQFDLGLRGFTCLSSNARRKFV